MNNLNYFNLQIACPGSLARSGELTTSNGTVATPVFAPVASQSTVRSLTPEEVSGIGIDMILANTYHLYLRPGIPVIDKIGGLHKFMAWDKAILTDSGGYQVFSLSPLRQVNDEGVVFRSHIDGSQHSITPELVMQFQEVLGADIIMVLDECPSSDASYEQVQRAVERTGQWAERCRQVQKRQDQSLYAIIQGGLFHDLREQSARHLVSLDFPGYAIGGLSVGEPKQVTWEIVDTTVLLLPEDKPRYLMGVGSPEDIVTGVDKGIDIFDSALPTRIARNGALFTRSGRINIRNTIYHQMAAPIDSSCRCYTCQTFSAAYVHHLFLSRELLGYRLATIHNLTFISQLMSQIRDAIENGSYQTFKNEFLAAYQPVDEQIRLEQKQKGSRTRNLSQLPDNQVY